MNDSPDSDQPTVRRLTYQDAGVDPEKAAGILGEFARYQKTRPRDPRVLAGIGPFASCFDLQAATQGYRHPVLVTTCDGVGTKVKLAKEWGETSGLGQDLVAMNVNDLLCMGALPVLFLDYFATGALEREQLLGLLKSIQHACEESECQLTGGETAEMPGIYRDGDFDLAGFAIGLAERDGLLGPTRARAGDVILALESAGPHSNGFSLIRRIAEREQLRPDDKTPFGGTWRKALLAPTRLYVKPLKDSMAKLHGLVHLTGGGLFENLPRVLPSDLRAVIDSRSWPFPGLFQWLQEKAGIGKNEMLSTFNCGVGMLAIVSAADADSVAKSVGAHVRCWPVGKLETAPPAAAPVEWT